MSTGLLCHQCACGVVNADWSHLDYPVHESKEVKDEHDSDIMASAEAVDVVDLDSTKEMPGYWDCFVCSETLCGDDAYFATLKD